MTRTACLCGRCMWWLVLCALLAGLAASLSSVRASAAPASTAPPHPVIARG